MHSLMRLIWLNCLHYDNSLNFRERDNRQVFVEVVYVSLNIKQGADRTLRHLVRLLNDIELIQRANLPTYVADDRRSVPFNVPYIEPIPLMRLNLGYVDGRQVTATNPSIHRNCRQAVPRLPRTLCLDDINTPAREEVDYLRAGAHELCIIDEEKVG
jgi:hypothetical protein